MGVLFFAVQIAFGILLPLGIQLLDRKYYMTEEERDHVWGFATWGSALYNFGPLSLVAWGYVTRSPSYLRGLSVGVALTAIALLLHGVLSEIAGRILGFSPAQLADNRLGVGAGVLAAIVVALLVGAGRAIYEAVRRRG